MKISYNWLNDYLNVEALGPDKLAEILTNTGLEVESYEKVETVKGGLAGVVVGEVITCERHPNADKLKCTTVKVAENEILNIVCGAPNVAAGQKVAVATVGTTLYFADGTELKIKKSKIRGEESCGMVCAEDELGIGQSHEGIMVLPQSTAVGAPIAKVLNLKADYLFEIGLTPNRSDAMCHIGVANDVAASINAEASEVLMQVCKPNVSSFVPAVQPKINLTINVEDKEACPLYLGLALTNVKVGESPDWLKEKLLSIGLKPKNNVVDVTNFVMHEIGQPLHAFDADKVDEHTIIVKKATEGSKFVSLDEIERNLSADDLMICNPNSEMCIAGVFGGIDSGVSENTTSVILESAIFDSVSIRKSARRHLLFTDASFRFERGVDPEQTEYALKRAALLLQEICGAEIASNIVKVDNLNFERSTIVFKQSNLEKLIGVNLEPKTLEIILTSLNFDIDSVAGDVWTVKVPGNRRDVERPVDVYEEVLRIYGYNKVQDPGKMHISVNNAVKPDEEKLKRNFSNFLIGCGFNEIMNNSLTAKQFSLEPDEKLVYGSAVEVLNPLSSDLGILRQSLLFGGLQTVNYNLNRQQNNIKVFEFGSTYFKNINTEGYKEEFRILMLQSGANSAETWHSKTTEADFFTLKAYVVSLLNRLGVNSFSEVDFKSETISGGIEILVGKISLGYVGLVHPKTLKLLDVNKPVVAAELIWPHLLKVLGKGNIKFNEISKFPQVRRDLALLVDNSVSFAQLHETAKKAERKLLKSVNLFDVYEGKNLPEGKKSYAISFILHNLNATLTDTEIEKSVNRIKEAFEKDYGATLR
jgi:phenylalanyl-tRNA synthetase beta chain